MPNFKKIYMDEDGYSYLLNLAVRQIKEERNLALDRYREQDKDIQETQDFMMQGRELVSFLKLASDRTDALVLIAKEIKSLAYPSGGSSKESGGSIVSDEKRRKFEEEVKKAKQSLTDKEQQNDITKNIEAKE